MKKYRKAVTFSYDDGVTYDRRLLDIFNKYGMKCSFNLNSGILADPEGKRDWYYKDAFVSRPREFDPHLYDGHEILLHGTEHLHMLGLSKEEWDAEFKEDKRVLEEAAGYPIVGGAYAFGDYDDELEAYLKTIGVKFMRTVKSTKNFNPSEDLLAYQATCHHNDEEVFDLVDEFLSIKEPETPQIFYIWGHSYEFEGCHNWERIEEICKKLAGQDDVLYGTNTEVFKYFDLI